MNPVTLLIGGLITWRLATMLVKEAGPVMVFMRMRAFLATHQKRSGGFFDLISCIYCVSVYVGLVASLFASHDVFQWIGYGLAFSAIACIIERLTNHSDPLAVVAPPAGHAKVSVGVRSTPEKGDDVVGDPPTPNGYSTVETPTTLND